MPFPAALALLALISSSEPKRDTQEAQIACQVRVVTVRDDLVERLGLKTTEALSDAQLRTLLEAVQGDRSSNVLQCPKVTALDGQEAVVKATEQQHFVTSVEASVVKGEVVMVPKNKPVETGTTVTLSGKASEDRKTVTMQVKYRDTRVESVELIPVTSQVTPIFEGGSRGQPIPFTQFLQAPKFETAKVEKQDLSIPSGGHAVIAGPTRMRESRSEFGPPLLSKIPYLNRLFTNVGISQVTMRTYLILSPVVVDVVEVPARRR